MVKNPDAACRPLRRGERGVEIGVDIEADRVGFPFDGVKMKVVGETLARGKLENGSKVPCAAGSAGAMQGTVNSVGFLSYSFHCLVPARVAGDGVGRPHRVWRRAVRAGEFVRPNQSPAGARLWHLRIAGIEEATTGEQRN